jgi:hypothetical protein
LYHEGAKDFLDGCKKLNFKSILLRRHVQTISMDTEERTRHYEPDLLHGGERKQVPSDLTIFPVQNHRDVNLPEDCHKNISTLRSIMKKSDRGCESSISLQRVRFLQEEVAEVLPASTATDKKSLPSPSYIQAFARTVSRLFRGRCSAQCETTVPTARPVGCLAIA